MRLEMRGIDKSFGANKVLTGVDLSLGEGEILALLGENGAGKSTLMNILGGVLPADAGEILLDGEVVNFRKPADSLHAGIAFIHQELNLINDLPIYENLFLGRELLTRYGQVDHRSMYAETAELFRQMEVDVDPATLVRDLDASYKQIVEIAKAMLMNASIIIMDEPTSSLTAPEIERIFDMMDRLRAQGVGIVFISHKLKEVLEICDRYLVLRDGYIVAEGRTSEATIDSLAFDMVGHDVRSAILSSEADRGEEILRAYSLSNPPYYHEVSFSVRAGEILGFTGLLGDGRTELFTDIFGARGDYSGQIYLEGEPLRLRNTTESVKAGFAYVPRNRKENGIIKDLNILENGTIVTWPADARHGFIDFGLRDQSFAEQARNLHIVMEDPSDSILSLSGGNQQKVVLAKWLSSQPKVLVLDNPTQGVDVGAKEEIYDIILRLADQGVAVIVLSSEAQEIIRVCDRALVMFHGNVQGEVTGAAMNERDIMILATGGTLGRLEE